MLHVVGTRFAIGIGMKDIWAQNRKYQLKEFKVPRTEAMAMLKFIISYNHSFLKSLVLFHKNSGPLCFPLFFFFPHKWLRVMNKETFVVNLYNFRLRHFIHYVCIVRVSLFLRIMQQIKSNQWIWSDAQEWVKQKNVELCLVYMTIIISFNCNLWKCQIHYSKWLIFQLFL